MHARLLPLLLTACATALVHQPLPTRGCAPVPGKPGEWVDVANETALIVWDAETKTQHFVRSASFTSTSAEFGFLVPTPTRPELAESSADVYATLAEWTAPRTVVERRPRPMGCGMPMASTGMAPNAEAGVAVLEQKRVGDFDAAVLKADDPAELRRWLATNGYDARPELERWLAWYTANKWVVTAFKIAADAADGGEKQKRSIKSAAVRMSFRTERPFFPYREPEDQRTGPNTSSPRLLRVFFVADGRYEGHLGETASPWPARTAWSNALAGNQVNTLMTAAKLPEMPATKAWYLTELEDRSSPRSGTDEVYFAKAADQSPVEREPYVRYEYYDQGPYICAACAAMPVFLLIGVLVLLRVLRRKK